MLTSKIPVRGCSRVPLDGILVNFKVGRSSSKNNHIVVVFFRVIIAKRLRGAKLSLAPLVLALPDMNF